MVWGERERVWGWVWFVEAYFTLKGSFRMCCSKILPYSSEEVYEQYRICVKWQFMRIETFMKSWNLWNLHHSATFLIWLFESHFVRRVFGLKWTQEKCCDIQWEAIKLCFFFFFSQTNQRASQNKKATGARWRCESFKWYSNYLQFHPPQFTLKRLLHW